VSPRRAGLAAVTTEAVLASTTAALPELAKIPGEYCASFNV